MMRYPVIQVNPYGNRPLVRYGNLDAKSMRYPARTREVTHGMNDAVKTVAGASVAMLGIGVIGAMSLGAMGMIRP